jgi:polar amino acid transport system substrate-binding protein
MKTWTTILAIAALLLATTAVRAEPVKLLVGDLPPFSIAPEGVKPGDASGFTADVMRAALDKAGIAYEFVPMSWPRAQAMAKSDAGYAIIGLTRIPAREPDYQWVAELLKPQMMFLAIKPHDAVDSLEAAKALKGITVRANTPFQEVLKAAGVDGVEAVQTEEQNARKLAGGRAEAWLTYDLRGLWVWKQVGEDPAKLVLGKPLSTEAIYLAANKGFDAAIAAKLAAAAAATRADGSYQAIYARYFGG